MCYRGKNESTAQALMDTERMNIHASSITVGSAPHNVQSRTMLK
jgi:hypothetical protein